MENVWPWLLTAYIGLTVGAFAGAGRSALRPRVALVLLAWPVLLPWWVFRDWLRLTKP